jgi:hypothetical protein
MSRSVLCLDVRAQLNPIKNISIECLRKFVEGKNMITTPAADDDDDDDAAVLPSQL